MKNVYYEKEAIIYSKIVFLTNNFMDKINAKFIKENHLCGKENFIIGENIDNDRVYTIDTFYNDDTKESSNNIVLDFKGEDNVFGYAELIKAGYLLLMETNAFEEEDITLCINIVSEDFRSEYEKLKLILVDLNIDFEEDEDLLVDSAKDFCFSYTVSDEYKTVGSGANYTDGIFFSLSIDDIIKNAENYLSYNSNYVNVYIVAEREEEKMYALKIMDEQRSGGLASLMFTKNISLEEQMKIAKESMCDYIIKVEEENLKKGLVTLIDNIYTTENDVDLEDLENHIMNNF